MAPGNSSATEIGYGDGSSSLALRLAADTVFGVVVVTVWNDADPTILNLDPQRLYWTVRSMDGSALAIARSGGESVQLGSRSEYLIPAQGAVVFKADLSCFRSPFLASSATAPCEWAYPLRRGTSYQVDLEYRVPAPPGEAGEGRQADLSASAILPAME